MECEIPLINSNKEQIKKIFEKTKTIAVIGLSPNPDKDSHKVAYYLKNQGFRVVPIYPRGEKILGEKVYNDLLEIPFEIDMVDVFRKPSACLEIVKKAIARKDVKTVWLGVGIVNNEAAKLAKEAGLEIVQNFWSMVEHKRLKAVLK